MTTYGLTNWDEVEIKKINQQNRNKDLYMKLQNGDNIIRILTKPHEYSVYQYKTDPNDKGFGWRILAPIGHDRDPIKDLNRKDLRPKRRWLVGIIDRRTQAYKILDLAQGAFKGIQELVRDEDWGDPGQYDINIKVDKDGGAVGYYTVIPKSKRPLNAGDLELKQQVDLEDLKRRCTPPTPEEVEKRMKFVDEKEKEGKKPEPVKTEKPAEDEDDPDFPAVDGSDA
jgi:hypothetical protein